MNEYFMRAYYNLEERRNLEANERNYGNSFLQQMAKISEAFRFELVLESL